MPDSTQKHIYIQPSTCDMEVRWKEIVTRCEVIASDKPFKQIPVKISSPDIATPTKSIEKTQPDTSRPKENKATVKK
jgi:hypothetical protein